MSEPSFTPVALRPMSLDDIVGESITLLLRHAPQFLALATLANLPAILWQVLTLVAPDQWVAPPRFQTLTETSSLSAFIAYLINGRDNLNVLMAIGAGALGSLMQSICVSAYAYQRAVGQSWRLAVAMQQAMTYFPAVFLGSAVPMAFIVLMGSYLPKTVWGNLAFLIVFVALYPRILFVPAAIALEGSRGLIGLWRSWRLGSAAYWRVLGIWLVLELVITVALLAPTLFMGLSMVNLVLGTTQRLINFSIGNLTLFVVDSFRSIALMLLFVDVRRRLDRRLDRQGAVEVAGI